MAARSFPLARGTGTGARPALACEVFEPQVRSSPHESSALPVPRRPEASGVLTRTRPTGKRDVLTP
jgi:hypothetical protein